MMIHAHDSTFVHKSKPSAHRENHSLTSQSVDNTEQKVTWEHYFQNYQKDNFEEEYGVKKGDLEEFAKKYELQITLEQYLRYTRNDDFEEDTRIKKHDFKSFAHKYHLNLTILPKLSYEDIAAGNDIFSPFTVRTNKGFNKLENSISLVPGVDIDLGNGFKLKIKDRIIDIDYDKRFYTDDKYRRASQIAAALNKFIRYANDQNGSFGFNDEQRKLVATALSKLGIDLERPFIVNGTTFTTKENPRGVLEKVGYEHMYGMLPSHMWEEVLNRYDANSKWV